MANEILELLNTLDRIGVLKETFADPRQPPQLCYPVINHAVVEEEHDDSVSEIDVGKIHKQPRPPKRDELHDENPQGPDILDWPYNPDEDRPIADSLKDESNYPNAVELPHDDEGGYAFVDSYAWYCPFHFYTIAYGIYIQPEGLTKVASQLAKCIPARHRHFVLVHRRLAIPLLKRAAFFYFFLHEMYHHKVESFSTRLEIIERQPRYVPYKHSVYEPARRPILTDSLIEEGLAVAEVLRRVINDSPYNKPAFWGHLGQGIQVRDLIIDFLQRDIRSMQKLPGYRTARTLRNRLDNISKEKFFDRQRKLMSMIQQSCLNPLGVTEEWRFATDIFSCLYDMNRVTYEVIPPGRSSTMPSKAAPAAQASPSKVMSKARKWHIRPVGRGGRTRGDHQWLENHRGTQNHIDTGCTDLSGKDWQALLGLVNDGWVVDLKDNAEGRTGFLRGPKRLGCSQR